MAQKLASRAPEGKTLSADFANSALSLSTPHPGRA
jgi:hypothetical protein